MSSLRPFWRYFGAKWRSAPRYPTPTHDTIVEPFAGAAGYALRYPDRRVILVERYAVVAAVWRYLIAVRADELRTIPAVECVDDLPSWVPQEARWLIGLRFGAGDSRPRARVSPMVRRDGGFDLASIADQVERIRHWTIIEGDYTQAPDTVATWFVDPPYQTAGSRSRAPGQHRRVRYPHGGDSIDYAALGAWTAARRGQVIACENVGATWLPFTPFGRRSSVCPGRFHNEAIWIGGATNAKEPMRPDTSEGS